MSRTTSLRRLLLGLATVLLLAVIVVFTYQAVRTVLALRQAVNAAHTLSGDVRRNDVEAVKHTLRTIQDRSDTARAHSDNFLWDTAARLPLVGDDIEAVQVMSRSLSEAADAASEPANTLLARVQAETLRDPDGQLNLDVIRGLAPSTEALTRALRGPARDVEALDADKLVGPLGDVTLNVQDEFASLLSTAEAGDRVVRVLPSMLGASGPRRYLLVVQNNAEIRSTGGLPGSLSILEADRGKLSLGAQHSVDDFDVLSVPALRLTGEERELYGDNLGENIRDTNLTPDFPRAAELMSALYQRSFGTRVDGVIAVDPVVLSSVLRATGPVEVGGETFTAGTVVRTLLHDVYQRFDTRKQQDAYFNKAARGIFNTLITRPVEPVRVLRKLGRSVGQRRFLVWSSHPEEQRELGRGTIGGELPPQTGDDPRVGLYLNDATAAKIEYYLDYRANIRSAACTESGSQTLQVGMVLTSSAPRRGFELSTYTMGYGRYAARGTMRMNLRMYAPAGGRITRLTANGEPVRIVTRQHHGRQVAIVTMFIRAREQVRLSAEIQTRAGQTGDPQLRWTPGVHTRSSDATATSSC